MWHVWKKKNSNSYRVLVKKPARKKPLGRLTEKCGNNIKIDIKET
jgi:hypothetical protein